MKGLKDVIAKYERIRPMPPVKAGDWLRASGLAYVCYREEALAFRYQRHRTEMIDAGTNANFLHGTVLHTGMQDVLLKDVLLGCWRCNGCLHVHGPAKERDELKRLSKLSADEVDAVASHELLRKMVQGYVPRPESCASCGHHGEDAFGFEESWMGDFELRVGGHTDGVLKVPWRDSLGIFEGKSIGWGGAKKIKHGPMAEHVIQTHIYMHLTGTDWASILYWQKSQFGMRAFVEHVVERDEEILEHIKYMVRKYRRSFYPGSELPKRICSSQSDERAKKECALSSICFGLRDGGRNPF